MKHVLLTSATIIALAGCSAPPTPHASYGLADPAPEAGAPEYVGPAPAHLAPTPVPAAPTTPKPVQAAAPEPTPVCKTKKQCEAMWVEAQSAVAEISGMRVQLATENMLQTYNPTSGSRLSGSVIKKPVSETEYQIIVSFACNDNFSACGPLIQSSTNLFNMRLNIAGAPFAPAAKPAKAVPKSKKSAG